MFPKGFGAAHAIGVQAQMAFTVLIKGLNGMITNDKFQTPPDLVVDHWTSDVESSSPLDFRLLHAMWTPFGCLMSYKIRPIISAACDFTTKSGGIWLFQRPDLVRGTSLVELGLLSLRAA